MKPVPILFLGDSPELNSGLARIGRDLAVLLSQNPRFRVGYLGLGGNGSSQLPFQQYVMQATQEQYEWGYHSLPRVWQDFAGQESGIVFTVWDMTRLLWLSRPEYVEDQDLKNFLLTAPYKIWSYVPIDSFGPDRKLTGMIRETLMGLDRILCYSPWARDCVLHTIGPDAAERKGLDWIPHGLDTTIWKPNLEGNKKWFSVGVVATNQPRKDWGLVAETCSILKNKFGEGIKFWWHTDRLVKHWSIPALLHDFGIVNDTEVTMELSNKEIAGRYQSCCLTIHPGQGEGFGYPIFESLACGVPAIHGEYAGGASILGTMGLEHYTIQPAAMRIDSQFNCYRPVHSAMVWADKAMEIMKESGDPAYYAGRVEHLSWPRLWPVWDRWFSEGVQIV